MGYLSFQPTEAQNRMKSIQAHYNQLFSEIDKKYRINITGLMSKGWVSPNGKAAIEKVTKDLNFVLARITAQVGNSFDQLNNVCVIAMNTLIDSKLGGGHYEGPYYKSMIFEMSNSKFSSDEAKTHLNGKLYIYDDKLNEVIENIQKFNLFVAERLDSIEANAKKMPIGDEGNAIIGTIEHVFKSIKQEIKNVTNETCKSINTKLSETDADVIQAKKNAKAAIEKNNVSPASSVVKEPVREEKVVESKTTAQVVEPAKEEPVVESKTVVQNESVSSVKVPDNLNQTGIIPNYTEYDKYYGKWNSGTKQCELSEVWASNGKTSDRGIATIDNNYLVATSTKFGSVGDKIGVVLDDGTTINCIIADTKGGDATSEWGHSFGNNGVDIIEWESLGPQDTIQLGDWKGKDVAEIVNYGSVLKS